MVSSSMQVVLNVLIGIGCLSIVNVEAFSPMLVEKSSSTTALFGAFNKGNKQVSTSLYLFPIGDIIFLRSLFQYSSDPEG